MIDSGHFRVTCLGDLDREWTNTSSSPIDQDFLTGRDTTAGLEAQDGEQRAVLVANYRPHTVRTIFPLAWNVPW